MWEAHENRRKMWEKQRNLVLIMAGGLGKRMNSDLPKVLHELNGLPLIVHVVKSALHMDATSVIYIIVGKYREQIEKAIDKYFMKSEYIRYINQPEPLGTGHAIQCCLPTLKEYFPFSKVLVLSGDVPLFSKQSMREVMNNRCTTIVCTQMEDPHGYGRIIQDPIRIVEEKDCSEEERRVKLVNCGIYAFKNEFLWKNLPKINNENAQQEYYLTSIFSGEEEEEIGLFEIPAEKQYEVCGINTPEQLEEMRSKTV
jgi:UDP-N-acetylglucosamine diphosphorylase/glucosamine-1-phosphate N-acetyltransferase